MNWHFILCGKLTQILQDSARVTQYPCISWFNWCTCCPIYLLVWPDGAVAGPAVEGGGVAGANGREGSVAEAARALETEVAEATVPTPADRLILATDKSVNHVFRHLTLMDIAQPITKKAQENPMFWEKFSTKFHLKIWIFAKKNKYHLNVQNMKNWIAWANIHMCSIT